MHKAITKDRRRVPVSRNGCGVYAYVTASDARRDSNRRNGRRPYECATCGLWHLRRLPAEVVAGVLTEAEWYGEGGHRNHAHVLLDVATWLAERGITEPTWTRGRDGESWSLTATVDGDTLAVHERVDPEAAGEAMFVLANVMRSRQIRDALRAVA